MWQLVQVLDHLKQRGVSIHTCTESCTGVIRSLRTDVDSRSAGTSGGFDTWTVAEVTCECQSSGRTYESPKKNLCEPSRWDSRFMHSAASRYNWNTEHRSDSSMRKTRTRERSSYWRDTQITSSVFLHQWPEAATVLWSNTVQFWWFCFLCHFWQ